MVRPSGLTVVSGRVSSQGRFSCFVWSVNFFEIAGVFLSYKGRAVDAWGQRADEGRGKRRYASGSCNQALIRGFPNGVTQHELNLVLLPSEHIGWIEGSQRTETSQYLDE